MSVHRAWIHSCPRRTDGLKKPREILVLHQTPHWGITLGAQVEQTYLCIFLDVAMSQEWCCWSRNCITTWPIVVSGTTNTNCNYSQQHFMGPFATVISQCWISVSLFWYFQQLHRQNQNVRDLLPAVTTNLSLTKSYWYYKCFTSAFKWGFPSHRAFPHAPAKEVWLFYSTKIVWFSNDISLAQICLTAAKVVI